MAEFKRFPHQSKDDSQHNDRIPAAQWADRAGNALEEPPENLEEPPENPALWLWVQLGQRRTMARSALPAPQGGEKRDQRKKPH